MLRFQIGLLLFFFLVGTFGNVNQANAAPISTTTVVQQPLVPFAGTVPSISKPVIGKAGFDLGTNTLRFTQSGIQFFRSSGNITLGPPNSLAASTSKNSTHIQYSFSGAGLTVKYLIRNDSNQYNRRIAISGTATGSQTLSIPLSNPNGFTASNCDTGNSPNPCSQVCFGVMCFNWADMPAATYNNQTRILSQTVTGNFLFDPIAIDGTSANSCVSCTAASTTLTTTNTNDIIYVICYDKQFTSGKTLLASATGLTFIQRADGSSSTAALSITENYAVSAATLSAKSITCTYSGVAASMGIVAVGISGADTVTIFDPNVALPCKGATASANPLLVSCQIATSNPSDMIFSLGALSGRSAASGTGGFSNVFGSMCGDTTVFFFCIQNQIVSTAQSGTVQYSESASSESGVIIGDAVCQANSGCAAPVVASKGDAINFDWLLLVPIFLIVAIAVKRNRR